jgi:hypothetical protein
VSSSKHTAESARRLALACPHIRSRWLRFQLACGLLRRSVGSLLWAYGCVPKWADLSSAEAWYLVSARLHVRADSPLGMSDLAARLTGRLFHCREQLLAAASFHRWTIPGQTNWRRPQGEEDSRRFSPRGIGDVDRRRPFSSIPGLTPAAAVAPHALYSNSTQTVSWPRPD